MPAQSLKGITTMQYIPTKAVSIAVAVAAFCAATPAMAGVVTFTWDPAGALPPLSGPGYVHSGQHRDQELPLRRSATRRRRPISRTLHPAGAAGRPWRCNCFNAWTKRDPGRRRLLWSVFQHHGEL